MLPPGTLVAERFEIEALAGHGGVGEVYRAKDRLSGVTVALKRLHGHNARGASARRFAREARAIAELRHPAVVAYIAHGSDDRGVPFLAMEWLEGHDLAAQLELGALACGEALAVLEQVAGALAAAHRQRLVHRDVKPSNLFLRGGQLDQVMLLDFGIARRTAGATALTRSGVLLGTPEYMAPEQVRGERAVSASADIFALGCVIYECLAGRPPFLADHVAAVLARILFEEAPQLLELRPDAVPDLAALVHRMLAKDPAARPRDGDALLAEIARLGASNPSRGLGAGERAGWPSVARERRLFSVIVGAEDSAGPPGPTRDAIDRALASLHGEAAWLPDGALVVILSSTRSATDLAVQAAHGARAIEERWPGARIAVATGTGTATLGPGGLGGAFGVVERARRLTRAPGADLAESRPRGILADTLSVDLLEGRFAIAEAPDGTRLLGERLDGDAPRLLLGKPTPCVGRERELGLLETTLRLASEDGAAQAVLVTAPPGAGKSRLCRELLRRLAARGPELEVLVGRGDVVSRGSPYGHLADALLRAAGARRGDGAELQASLLARYVEARLGPSGAADRVLAFIAAMCGATPAGEPSAHLAAARRDPSIMREQVSHAFVELLRGACARCPTLLVLDDLHWGDALTVEVVDTALRELHDQPLVVIALGRGDVKDLFPRLWEMRARKEVALGKLGRVACAELTREVLGAAATPEVIARITERAAGNALYVEELIRATAEGNANPQPPTVLAMLQARISSLAPEARHLLRVASVFGETAWHGGIVALAAPFLGEAEVSTWIERLVTAELIEPRRESRLAGEAEYAFRHDLLRDAAYALLTEEDRALGHRLAHAYLTRAGERDPLILAEHARLGHDHAQAAPLYLLAAERAFACDDWGATRALSELGLTCGAASEARGRLLALQAFAHHFRSEVRAAHPLAEEAAALLPPGSLAWCRAMSVLQVTSPTLGHLALFEEVVKRFTATEPAEDARATYLETAAWMVSTFSCAGQRVPAAALVARVRAVSAELGEEGLWTRGLVAWAEGSYTLFLEPDPAAAAALTEQGRLAFVAAGHTRNLAFAELCAALAHAAVGERPRAEAIFAGGVEGARRRRELMPEALLKCFHALLLLRPKGASLPGRAAEAERLALEVIADQGTVPALLGHARGVLARVHLASGDLARAEIEVRRALDLLAPMPLLTLPHLATLVHAELRAGRAGEAAAVAEQGLALVSSLGGAGAVEVELRLAAALGLDAAGRRAEAEEALREVCHQIEIRAATLRDPDARARFLEGVPENAEALALARAWFGVSDRVNLPSPAPPPRDLP